MGVFKAYDIRGTYPDQINEELAYKIGRAFVTLFKTRNVAVGRDMRQSSDRIFDALAKGITEQGANVINIGMTTTPMMYFAVGKHKYDGGIMITASHNPAKYNGFKMVRENAVPIGGETGIFEMEKLVSLNKFHPAKERGKIHNKEGILHEYVENELSFSDSAKLKKFKLVVDSANAMSSPAAKEFFKKIPCELIHMYPELDGSFPNHEANPLKLETLKDLQDSVKKNRADVGIAFDGDADRVAFIDEKGEIISSDLITALVAEAFLLEKPGYKILYDLRSSKAVKEAIESNKGTAIMCRVGHSLIKAQMREEKAKFAGELSGHYYLKDNYYVESPFAVILKILELMTKTGKTISELIRPLAKYYATGEINSEVEDKDSKMKELAAKYSDANIFWLDGVSVEYPDWWFNVRPSNTEPLLRLNLEADTKEKMEKKREEVLAIIRG